jgi:hypothetical protein
MLEVIGAQWVAKDALRKLVHKRSSLVHLTRPLFHSFRRMPKAPLAVLPVLPVLGFFAFNCAQPGRKKANTEN